MQFPIKYLSTLCIFFTVLGAYAQAPFSVDFKKESVIVTTESPKNIVFTIYRGRLTPSQIEASNPIIGERTIKENAFHFLPLVPFSWEQEYTVVINEDLSYVSLATPSNYNTMEVSRIYPSSEVVPSNILKWHVQFSHPINKTSVYKHIEFRNEKGIAIPRAILPLENILISDDGRLLTLWVEPGRQKRGLIPNEELGAVFQKGQKYSLHIAKELKDENGIAMSEDYLHSFVVHEADRLQPNVELWKIKSPTAVTTSPLHIDLQQPLDYVSATNKMVVMNNEGLVISGTWALYDGDTTLSFTPDTSWSSGAYWLQIDPRLDDLAGNNLIRLFDSPIESNNATPNLKRSFTVH